MIKLRFDRRSIEDDLISLRVFTRTKNSGSDLIRKNFATISKLYHDYTSAVESPYKHLAKPRLSKSCQEVIYGLYSRKLVSFSHIGNLRNGLKKTLGCCPYCGIPGSLTLDHYLPKSYEAFPEYAVLSDNLVAACNDCQSAKGHSYAKKNLNRAIISRRGISVRRQNRSQNLTRAFVFRRVLRVLHPYLDGFFNSPVTTLKMGTERDYKLVALGHLDQWQRKCVRHHVQTLGIQLRAADVIKRYRTAFARSLHKEGIKTEDEIKSKLPVLMEGAKGRAVDDENALEVVYVRSISTDPELLTDLLDSILTIPKPNKVVSRGYLNRR